MTTVVSTPRTATASAPLASFLAKLTYADLPDTVVARTEDLFLDWIGSALAGKGARQVTILERFAQTMGPESGPCEILPSWRRTSPLFAALVNGAASHVVEQDDVHNGSVFHPGTVVFPAALAVAQASGATGREFITAAVAGYEAGIRIGEFLGRSHYRVFHTTGTAGTLAAAAAAAHLLLPLHVGVSGTDSPKPRVPLHDHPERTQLGCALDAREDIMLHALGSAGTQAAGLWEFLRDAADSKQLHTGKAAADGLLSAYIAADGFTGARRILEGPQGMAAGMSTDADPAKLTDRLGERWAILETSFKYHASCRHTHPAADALLAVMQEHHLVADDILRVRARVHGGAIDVLGPIADPQTTHQAKFCMGFVLALVALHGRAGVTDFTEDALRDPRVRDFMERVEMTLDPEIDAAYPVRWIGLVEVETRDGQRLVSRVDVPKGDPDNTLTRDEIEDKARRLAAHADAATTAEMDRLIARVWTLERQPNLRSLLA